MGSMPEFDPEAAVARYRRVIAQLETEPSVMGQHELRGIAKRLRERWIDWQGEDSLHAMAFGKPEQRLKPCADASHFGQT
jgi:hypothetical protein